jgi:hypothetical protein
MALSNLAEPFFAVSDYRPLARRLDLVSGEHDYLGASPQ